MDSLPELKFATSGIRGMANTVISPELGLRVGRAVASWIQKKYDSNLIVYIGYDNRRNSHTIASTIVAGLSSSGIDALLFSEPVPTPLVIYTTANTDAKAGLMVTGSHLPRDENGIILFGENGDYFKGVLPDSEQEPVEWDELGKIRNVSMEIQDYRKYLIEIRKDLKLSFFDWDVLVDPVHGPMKSYLNELLTPLLRNMIKFNWEDDDTFSGRLSEPTPKNLRKTLKAVEVSHCDLGIATDMDGDRVIFITSDNKFVTGDYIGAILARRFMKEYPDIPVIVPINTSAIINYVADEVNGKMQYCKVGPPSIINAMRESGAKYGFEETGKYFFADHGIWPDSAVSILMVLSYLQEENKSLKDVVSAMPKFYSSKTKVPSKRSDGPAIMQKVSRMVEEEFSNVDEVNNMDGLRINFVDRSWLLIRPSGTEDYIRVFSEHNDPDKNDLLNETGRTIVNKAISELK